MTLTVRCGSQLMITWCVQSANVCSIIQKRGYAVVKTYLDYPPHSDCDLAIFYFQGYLGHYLGIRGFPIPDAAALMRVLRVGHVIYLARPSDYSGFDQTSGSWASPKAQMGRGLDPRFLKSPMGFGEPCKVHRESTMTAPVNHTPILLLQGGDNRNSKHV